MDNLQPLYYSLHHMERDCTSRDKATETWCCTECDQKFRVAWPHDAASMEMELDDVHVVYMRGERGDRMITSIAAYHPYGTVIVHQGESPIDGADERDSKQWSWLLRDVDFTNGD